MCKKLIFFCWKGISKNIALRYNMYMMTTKNISIYQIFIQKKCDFDCIVRTQRTPCTYTFFKIRCIKTHKKYLKTDAKIFL